MRASALLLLVALGGCRVARYGDCAVQCAVAGPPCPQGLGCGPDGYCHAAGDDLSCLDLSVAVEDMADPYLCSATRPCATGTCACGHCAVPSAACDRSLAVQLDVADAGACVPGVRWISAHVDHGCLVKTDGTVFCWGEGSSGQLGTLPLTATCGTSVVLPCSRVPVLVRDASGAPFDRVLRVSTGAGHTCALRDDGTVWCWGRGTQLGSDVPDAGLPYPAPQQVLVSTGAPLGDMGDVAAGYTSTCALARTGEVWCWGDDSYGQTGDDLGVPALHARQMPTLAGAQSVTVGAAHACATIQPASGRTSQCWGRNNLGQLGNGSMNTPPMSTTPTTVLSATPDMKADYTTAVSAGNAFTCAMTLTNRPVVCWGENRNGALGNGITGVTAVTATQVKLSAADLTTGLRQLEGGDDHACALLGNGELRCWGGNQYGQLGVPGAGTPDAGAYVLLPINVPGNYAQITVGFHFTCAITEADNRVECWGDNGWGQLGDGTTMSHDQPAAIAPACP